MTISAAHTAWWRPEPAAASARDDRARAASTVAIRARAPGNPVAFGALLAFTAILLLSPQIWFPALGSLRIAFLAAALAIGAHLLDRLTRRFAHPPSPELLVAVVLVSWAVLTVPVSYWPGGSVEVLTDRFLKAVAFFWLIGTLATTPARLRTLVWVLVLCSIPLAGIALNNYATGAMLSTGVRGFSRIAGYTGSGLVANPNDLALMLNLIIPIAGGLAVSTRRPAARAVAAGALFLSVAAVIVTFSRAGFVTLAVTGAIGIVVLARRRAPGAAAVLLVLALGALPLLPQGYLTRLSTITNIEADATGSAQGRWLDARVAMGVIARSPIIGAGIGQDVLVMNEERGATWRRVHNAYLQYGVDLGIPGLLLFAWLHLLCFRTARAVEARAARDPAQRALAPLAAGVWISLAAFGAAAMFHPIAYHFYFFTVAGLAVALRNTLRT